MINLVLARTQKNYIGYDNDLICKNKEDMKNFVELTKNSVVVMGSKTFESIGSKPLPRRTNIVLTSKVEDQKTIYVDGKFSHILCNINELEYLLHLGDGHQNIWCIGGGKIYDYFLDNIKVNNVYLTTFKDVELNIEILNEDKAIKFDYDKLVSKTLSKLTTYEDNEIIIEKYSLT